MKKIFLIVSLIAATMVSAKEEIKSVSTREINQELATPMLLGQIMQNNTVKQVSAEMKTGKDLKSLQKSSRMVAPQSEVAVMEQPSTTDVYVNAIDYTYFYYIENQDWYGTLHDEDGNTYTFDIICDSTLKFPTDGVQYTYDDMIAYYTFANINRGKVTKQSTDAKFRYWIDVDSLEHIDAEMTCVNGVTYYLSYVTHTYPESFVDRYDTLRVVSLNDFRTEDSTFQFVAVNDSMEVAFAIKNVNIPGHYTVEDMFGELDWYTYININEVQRDLCNFEADVEAIGTRGEYKIDVKMYAYNGKCYNISMNYMLPEVVDTIQVVCDNLDFSTLTFYGVFVTGYTIDASNEDYTLHLDMGATSGVFNTLKMIDNVTGKSIDIYESVIIVERRLYAYGAAIDYDGHLYEIEISAPVPDSSRSESIELTSGILNDMTLTDGLWQLVGMNNDSTRLVTIAVYADQLGGEYSEEDALAAYTYVADWDTTSGGYALVTYEMMTLHMNVSTNNDHTVSGSAQLLGVNVNDSTELPLYTISWDHLQIMRSGMEQDATDADYMVDFAREDMMIDDANISDGIILLAAEDAEGHHVEMLFLVEDEDEQITIPAGTYPIDYSAQAPSVLASKGVNESGSIYYSFAGILDEEGNMNLPLWLMVDGEVLVENRNGSLTITVDAINSNGRLIKITMNAGVSACENLRGETIDALKFIRNGELLIERNGRIYHMNGQN
ncbi:MAG: hypothetical protein MJZ82_01310 [Paludibacteraceae bacterium]|nr:hypothetical protein [Paludibacteraceae bacterium]